MLSFLLLFLKLLGLNKLDSLRFSNLFKIVTEVLPAKAIPESNEVTYELTIPKSKYQGFELFTVNIIDDISACSSESFSKLRRYLTEWWIEISSTGPYDGYSPNITVELILIKIIN